MSADMSVKAGAQGPRRQSPDQESQASGTFRFIRRTRSLKPNKALTTLGRPGIQVAAITRRQDGFFIVHVDSDTPNNYPLVNGIAIGSQARKLTDNDVIQLAGVKMGFFEA